MGFLGIGAMEALVIIVAALIIFGPGRLPEVMGQAGRVLRDLRRASEELTGDFRESIQEVRQTYDELEADMRDTARELQRETNQIAKEVNTAVTDATKSTPARTSRSRPPTAQKLDQLGVDGDRSGTASAEEPAASTAPGPQAKPKQARASANDRPLAAPAGGDDLLAADDADIDLLSLNGAHQDAKDESPASD